VVIVFIALSATIFVIVGRPVRTLVLVGAVNGLILPLALGSMLIAANRRGIVGTYRHPRWLTGAGIVVTGAMAVAGAFVLWRDLPGMLR
jgi:Mn2+/Fe2+ NRAMP family transporter